MPQQSSNAFILVNFQNIYFLLITVAQVTEEQSNESLWKSNRRNVKQSLPPWVIKLTAEILAYLQQIKKSN